MKKIKNILSISMISMLFLCSCNSNEIAIEEEKTFEFAKTTEMLNFENALKKYFQEKQQTSTDSKTKTQITIETVKVANELLASFGKTELTRKSDQNPDLLIRTALRAYSEKLTEMYNQQKMN